MIYLNPFLTFCLQDSILRLLSAKNIIFPQIISQTRKESRLWSLTNIFRSFWYFSFSKYWRTPKRWSHKNSENNETLKKSYFFLLKTEMSFEIPWHNFLKLWKIKSRFFCQPDFDINLALSKQDLDILLMKTLALVILLICSYLAAAGTLVFPLPVYSVTYKANKVIRPVVFDPSACGN